jgi:hypothetical protein
MLLLKGLDPIFRLVTPNNQHSKIVVVPELVPDSLQMRQFRLAWTAPSCEETEHDYLPTQIDRMKRRSFNACKPEVRGGVANMRERAWTIGMVLGRYNRHQDR